MKCIFCEITARREPASIIYEDDRVIAFMGVQPINPGECMVIPKAHIDHFTDMPDALAAHVMTVGQHLARKLREIFRPLRVGLVVHGFGVPHAHLLLIAQHRPDDITSGRFARIEQDRVRFSLSHIPVVSREQLDAQAKLLRIETPISPAGEDPPASIRHRISAGAIVIRDDRILLVHHAIPGREDFWVPPGGGAEGAETIMDCVVRECFEETGLRVSPHKIVYVEEFMDAGRHICKHWIQCEADSGDPNLAHLIAEEKGTLIAARFFNREEMASLNVYPRLMRDVFWDDYAAGFPTVRYIHQQE